MKRVIALLNKTARRNRKPGTIEAAAEALRHPSVGADVVVTDGSSLEAAARDALAKGYEVIAAGGGDGTLNAVSSVVAGTDAAFAAIPLGTLNHFAQDAGIPLDIEGSVGLIRSGETKNIDLGDVNGRRFLNNSSVGLYPWLVRHRARFERRGFSRWFSMARAVWGLRRGLPELTVTMSVAGSSVVKRTPFVFIGNNRYEMETLNAWKREQFDDGVLTVSVLHDRSRWAFAKLAVSALLGRLKANEEFDVIGLAEVTVDGHGERMDVALDGEVRSIELPLTYKVLPRALKMILPQDT